MGLEERLTTCVRFSPRTAKMVSDFAARNNYSVSQAIRECITFTVENEHERAKKLLRQALARRRTRRAGER